MSRKTVVAVLSSLILGGCLGSYFTQKAAPSQQQIDYNMPRIEVVRALEEGVAGSSLGKTGEFDQEDRLSMSPVSSSSKKKNGDSEHRPVVGSRFDQIPILVGTDGSVYDWNGTRIPENMIQSFFQRNPVYMGEFLTINQRATILDTPKREQKLRDLEHEFLPNGIDEPKHPDMCEDYYWALAEADVKTAKGLLNYGMKRLNDDGFILGISPDPRELDPKNDTRR